MTVQRGVSCNRAILVKRTSGNMLANLTSDIVDFHDMKTGSIQVWYKNTNNIDAEFEVFVSDYPDLDSFARFPDSRVPIDTDCQSVLWTFTMSGLGFRYALVKYYKGPTLTTGDMEIIALGKK